MLDSLRYDPHSPKVISNIVGNTDIWTQTAELIRTNSASHLVLVGPAGCGKSLFLRIALTGFPTLIIDCTANFGLRDVRDTIRIFARGSKTNEGRLRWIIFERADALTADTQAFLRRMLETTANTTRIVFECRDSGAISEPIISRSSIVCVQNPESTEAIYELLRRTDFKLDRDIAASIVKHSYGNMRSAIMNALAYTHCGGLSTIGAGNDIIDNILKARPDICGSKSLESDAWVQWAITAEMRCKLEGIDLRDILRIGWPQSPVVSNTCVQWSRLGGTSPRNLFFDCVASLISA
jgi:replication factor C small subunit